MPVNDVVGSPVAFVSIKEVGVPPAPLNRTGAPAEPVLTARAAAMPVPSPETPVEMGRPVALVRVPELGVPNAPPLTTTDPAVPVFTASAVATPVPKPLTPVEIGNPVILVATPLAGVPSAGATSVLFDNVSVPAKVARVPVVGKVTAVLAVAVNVVVNAPDVVKEPPSDTDFPPTLATVKAPVPVLMVASPLTVNPPNDPALLY